MPSTSLEKSGAAATPREAGPSLARRAGSVLFKAERPETRQGRGLEPFIERFGLPASGVRRRDRRRGDGLSIPRRVRRHSTKLDEYRRRVASAVGLDLHQGIRSAACAEAGEYAVNLGLGSSVSTNILRDTRSDSAARPVALCRWRILRAFGWYCRCSRQRRRDRAGAATGWDRRGRAREFYRASGRCASGRRFGRGWWPPKSMRAGSINETSNRIRAPRLRRLHGSRSRATGVRRP